jgi:hypothetical protein
VKGKNDRGNASTATGRETRVYPQRTRADLQRALDEILPANTARLVGVEGSFRYEELIFADLLQVQREAKLLTAVQYADLDTRPPRMGETCRALFGALAFRQASCRRRSR